MEQEHDKLPAFIHWLQANGVQLRVSAIKHSHKKMAGLGVFAACDTSEDVLMVTPLHLAITPMSVLQDSDFGSAYAKLFEDGVVDDRLLMILFLMVERIRGSLSLWAPYLDVLPTTFGTPLWFTDEELEELKGTALYNATKIQLRNLRALFADKVKPFVEQMLCSAGLWERETDFRDFLWANCIFWTRALNIPCPHSFVFPKQVFNKNVDSQGESMSVHLDNVVTISNKESRLQGSEDVYNSQSVSDTANHHSKGGSQALDEGDVPSKDITPDTVWVEGLVPAIDFCNHAPRGIANWEVDGPEGSTTGVPNSMYLKTDRHLCANDEILISYGNKGNEELLFLYGFVIENNPDDFFMVHFPKEAFDQDPLGEVKVQLLQQQNLTIRWLLPTTLLQKGFYNSERSKPRDVLQVDNQACHSSFSWSGIRKPPSFLNQCVYSEETLAALRVVAMKENDMQQVLSMLEELSQSGLQEDPTDDDIRAAVWEVCGNLGALQLLTDLIAARLLELEEGSGSEDADQGILNSIYEEPQSRSAMSENRLSCIIYRKGQKNLANKFLKEAERLLELSIAEEGSRRQ